MTPIIPPWTGPGVEPAWPVRVAPWPPEGMRVEVADPTDPWSDVHLYDEVTGHLLPPVHSNGGKS